MTLPEWALLQVSLRAELESAWREFAATYVDEMGALVPSGRPIGRDGADDFLEAIFNWPTLYTIGGSADLLQCCKRVWRGVGRQLEGLGLFRDGFELGYDWFHVGEGLELFYNLCIAAPDDPELVDAAARFASLYLPDSPAGNYDDALRIIRAPHNGAGGPRPGLEDELPRFGTERTELQTYGLPVRGLPGIAEWADLDEPGNAERMAAAMQERFGSGDVAVNLSAVSLVTIAWLLTGEARWRDWIADYVGGWIERAEDNGGLIPDNVGIDGSVGTAFDGRWYGGLYGWTWPHGIHSLLPAALNAGAGLLTACDDPSGLALARGILETASGNAVHAVPADRAMTMKRRWSTHFGDEFGSELELWPTRFGDDGWFDEQPPQVAFPVWLWYLSHAGGDQAFLDRLRGTGGWDWGRVRPFRDKEEAGHEDAWFAAITGGDIEGFATRMLTMAHGQVRERLDAMRADDMAGFDQDRWQRVNPVVTEALVMTALGAPQALYNGGLQYATVRYLDPETGRPGLPPRVAALVESIGPDRIIVQLVNLAESDTCLIVQTGGFAEYEIVAAEGVDADGGDPAHVDSRGASRVVVQVPGRSRVRVTLEVVPSRGGATLRGTAR
jgi:hypothetical protein